MGERSTNLQKEVLPPDRQQSGLGIMLIASACMFFAVSSSALLLRTTRNHACPAQQRQLVHSRAASQIYERPVFVAPTAAKEKCGQGVVQAKDERGEEVVFRLCSASSKR